MFRGMKKPASMRVGTAVALALIVVALAACGGGSGKPDFNNKAVLGTAPVEADGPVGSRRAEAGHPSK